MMIADAGAGVSTRLIDYAFWLDDVDNDNWYEALKALDARGDKRPLLRLLRAGPAPKSVCLHLADLLSRYELCNKKGRGRKHVPTYERTPRMAKLEQAVLHVQQRPHGVPIGVAISQIARLLVLPEGTVADAYAGKHGGLNRARRGTTPA